MAEVSASATDPRGAMLDRVSLRPHAPLLLLATMLASALGCRAADPPPARDAAEPDDAGFDAVAWDSNADPLDAHADPDATRDAITCSPACTDAQGCTPEGCLSWCLSECEPGEYCTVRTGDCFRDPFCPPGGPCNAACYGFCKPFFDAATPDTAEWHACPITPEGGCPKGCRGRNGSPYDAIADCLGPEKLLACESAIRPTGPGCSIEDATGVAYFLDDETITAPAFPGWSACPDGLRAKVLGARGCK